MGDLFTLRLTIKLNLESEGRVDGHLPSEFTIEMLEDPVSQIERYTRSSREGFRD